MLQDSRDDKDLADAYGIDAEVLGSLPPGRFTLVNFFRLREQAIGPDGLADGRSGLEAMMQYASTSGACLEAAGGRFLSQGLAAGALRGEDSQDWDIVVAAEYPYGDALREIGRASCRDRVCKYLLIVVVPGSLKKKQTQTHD